MKVTVVGAGNVGATCANVIAERDFVHEVVLLDIYPAREKPIPGITSKILLEKITSSEKTLQTKEEVLLNLQSGKNWDVLATVGAGDIDTLVQPIKKILEKL